MIKNKILYLAITICYSLPLQASDWKVYSYSKTKELQGWAENLKTETAKENFNIVIANDESMQLATNNILYHSDIDQTEQWIDASKLENKITELSSAQSMATTFMSLTQKDSLCVVNTKQLDDQILNKEYHNSISNFDDTRLNAKKDITNNLVVGEDIQKFIFNHEIGHCLVADRYIKQFKSIKNVDLFLAFPKLSITEIEDIESIVHKISENNEETEKHITAEIQRYTIYINENYADAYALVYGKISYSNIEKLSPFIAKIRLTDSIQQAELADHNTYKLLTIFINEYQHSSAKSHHIIDTLVNKSTLSFKEFILEDKSNNRNKKIATLISNTVLDNAKILTVSR